MEEFEEDNKFKDDLTFKEFENEFKDDHAFEEFENEFKDDHTFEEFEFQADRVWKLGLIFTYYKSKVSGRSGQEIGTNLHLLQIRGLRLIGFGNLDKTNSQMTLLGFPSYTKPSLKIS